MTCHQCRYYRPNAVCGKDEVKGFCYAPACMTGSKPKPIYQPYQPGCKGLSFEERPVDKTICDDCGVSHG